jgi:hypothetical protein
MRLFDSVAVGLLSVLAARVAIAQASDVPRGSTVAPAPADSATAQGARPAAPKTSDLSAPVSTGTVELGLLFGYGFSREVDFQYRLGGGLRAGYKFPINVYLGATFVYHGGGQTNKPPTVRDRQSNVFYGGGELGYAVDLYPVEIRPYVGFGALHLDDAYTLREGWNAAIGTTVSRRETHSGSMPGMWPGMALIFRFGFAFVGVDARYVVPLVSIDLNEWAAAGWANGFGVYATGGASF